MACRRIESMAWKPKSPPARQSYQYVDVLTGTVELFDAETGERLFDYVAAETEE